MALNDAQFSRLKQGLISRSFQSPAPEEDVSFFGEPIQDIKQTIGGIKKTALETGQKIQQITSSDDPFQLKMGQVSGTALGGASNIVGETFKGAARLALTRGGEQRTKEFVGKAATPVVNHPKVQELVGWYQGLDESSKRTIDASLGGASFALDVALLGGGKKVAEEGAKIGASQLGKAGQVLKKPTSATGKALQGVGEKLYSTAAPPSEATKIALQAYEATQPNLWGRVKNMFGELTSAGKPITEAETAARYGLSGTQWRLGVQAKQVAQKLWDETIAPSLKGAKDRVNMRTFIVELEKDIRKIGDLSRRKELLKGLQKFKNDYNAVGEVSVLKLQEYKQGWAQFIPDAYYRGKPIASALKEVRNLAAEKARNHIYNITGNKQAYIDYGNLIHIQELARKSIDQLRSKSPFRQVWEIVLDNAVIPVSTFGGKVIYRTGQGLEFIGERGAKTIRDILGPEDTPTQGFKRGVGPKNTSNQDEASGIGAALTGSSQQGRK